MNKKIHFGLFDYYRAFFAFAVIAWHTQALGTSEALTDHVNFKTSISDVAYFNIFLLAVPVFLLISLFLYNINREINENYFWHRIKHLSLLFIFWVFLKTLLNHAPIPQSFYDLLVFFLSGGSRSLFYFFSSLLILTVMTEIILRLKKYMNEKLFIYFCLVLLVISCTYLTFKLSIINFIGGGEILLQFWSPFNFLPYSFLAILCHSLHIKNIWPKINMMYIFGLFVLYGLVCSLEWVTLHFTEYVKLNGYVFPPYDRVSLVIGAFVLLLIAMKIEINPLKPIRVLSQLSLGIYCIHYFVIYALIPFHSIIPNSLTFFVAVSVVSFLLAHTMKFKNVI